MESGTWPHPLRLPLGGGWVGQCSAPGHAGETPSDEELQQFCNLGYAKSCSRMPEAPHWDAIRFAVAHDRGSRIELWFSCEANHRPVAHGTLEYDLSLLRWNSASSDVRIERLAQCYLESYLLRRAPVQQTETTATEQ
jgi:hypothetical protein